MNVELNLTDADLDAISDRVAVKLAEQLSAIAAAGGDKNGRVLWTEEETADRLAVSKHTLKAWRLEGSIACFSTKPVRYSQANIDAVMVWLRTREDSK